MTAPDRPLDFDEFDPYYRWLGIQKKFRPPTHYQLLGVAVTESDRGIIEAASNRHLNNIQQYRGTQFDAIANRLGFEIEVATVTLLSGQLRSEYDLTLKSKKKSVKIWGRRNQTVPYTPTGSVGEGSEIVSTFAGVMGVILLGIIIMAGVTFYFPWQRVVFSGSAESAGSADRIENNDVNRLIQNQVDPQPHPPQRNIRPDAANVAKQEVADDILASIDALIVGVDFDKRSITVKHGSKIAEFDVSKKAVITVDGKESPLESLTKGQFAFIEFNPEFDVAVKIVTKPAPTVVAEVASETPPKAPPEVDVLATEVQSDNDVSIDATLTVVDLDKRLLTFERNSRSITLEFTGSTKVSLDGTDASPESFSVGQSGTVTFDPEYDVIINFEITGIASPEVPAGPSTPSEPKTEEPSGNLNLVSVDVTIESVDVELRTMKVIRGSKPSTFDVSRKAKITIDGFDFSLEELPVGQVATITFDPELEVISEIELTTTSPEAEPSK